ncbi:MAG: hypothetical protein RL216_2727 [Pseudomonadota bacterium]|jgi:hypothetical protein
MNRSETLAETMVITSNFPHRTPRSASRRLVAIVAATATALGLLAGAAIPARADNGDLAKALAALAVVGIIAHQANKNRNRAPVYLPDAPYPPQPQPQPVRAARVPAACAIEISGNSGTATVFGERCLREQGFTWRLPQYCARSARIYGQSDRIYSDQCLRDAGFRVSASQY